MQSHDGPQTPGAAAIDSAIGAVHRLEIHGPCQLTLDLDTGRIIGSTSSLIPFCVLNTHTQRNAILLRPSEDERELLVNLPTIDMKRCDSIVLRRCTLTLAGRPLVRTAGAGAPDTLFLKLLDGHICELPALARRLDIKYTGECSVQIRRDQSYEQLTTRRLARTGSAAHRLSLTEGDQPRRTARIGFFDMLLSLITNESSGMHFVTIDHADGSQTDLADEALAAVEPARVLRRRLERKRDALLTLCELKGFLTEHQRDRTMPEYMQQDGVCLRAAAAMGADAAHVLTDVTAPLARCATAPPADVRPEPRTVCCICQETDSTYKLCPRCVESRACVGCLDELVLNHSTRCPLCRQALPGSV